VQDLQLDISLGGMIIAAVSVVSSGLQQIFVRTMQQKHKLSAHELLSNTAPAQAWTLMLVGPFIDKLVSQSWVFNYQWTSGEREVVPAGLVNHTRLASARCWQACWAGYNRQL
jgi:solute carrier family 35 protein E3